jgi:amino acid adenylation domain-containing protein
MNGHNNQGPSGPDGGSHLQAPTLPAPESDCLHELFAVQAARTPDALAVVSEGERLNYRELDQRSNQLAHHLRALGIGPDAVVGVSLPRSPALIVALLGILKAGGAYLPLDPNDPAVRLQLMASDAGARFVLTGAGAANFTTDCPRIDLDVKASAIAMAPTGAARSEATASNLAYIIFTSGSTGRPKGVMVPHRGVVNMLRWLAEFIGMTHEDAVPHRMSVGFDFSVQEIFLPLISGARLLLATPVEAAKGRSVVSQLEVDDSATVVSFVPSVLESWLRTRPAGSATSARTVVCCGEALPCSTVTRLRSNWDGMVCNLYGPTEASVFSSGVVCGRAEHGLEPIGCAISNVRLYVLNQQLEPVGAMVPGELYIGGVGLARGYVGRPGMTADRFVASPFGVGERIYRTGDLARRLPDGSLEYVGRVDRQVKLRGHRIELEEVESRLVAIPAIREASVVVCDGDGRERQLVAFIVRDPTSSLEPGTIRRHLEVDLPHYMVPADFVFLERFPLNANGKLDRSALHMPGNAGRQPRPELRHPYVRPRNRIETRVARIWEELIDVAPVGVFDDFLDLGGHSMLAIRMIASIRDEFAVELTVRDVFSAMNVAGIAGLVEASETVETEEL